MSRHVIDSGISTTAQTACRTRGLIITVKTFEGRQEGVHYELRM
jgi:hypothetical protein